MRDTRFDTLTRRLAESVSRRTAVGAIGAGFAAATIAQASAQDATPAGTSAGLSLLFVQHAGSTTLGPGSVDSATLTMTGVTSQTLYFSDRPVRLTGALPTASFAAAFPQVFADDPPNAVLIGHPEAGADDEESVVIELTQPVYDLATATLTFEVQLLDAGMIGERGFEGEPLADLSTMREYAEAHLFIDDAPMSNTAGCMADCARRYLTSPDPTPAEFAAYIACTWSECGTAPP
jgi:hypothetical protein